ncbi:alpha/beta fold hydrolase [Paenibacillus physcomitrellae]|uniref:Alpha/beta hydrolase n=1 Tax=Paenibacillus physcomitrellae TaxID=1619311 RepID=A0ABQ1FLA5_9BACL|nr:alpha/beta hydrolase [Paenibacillus physcomitrellae]GGA19766.1 alpha/beta hydrolase [Paenibacillus physcomitrellae]
MPFANLNGTKLYYEMKGNGVPIVFVHGHGLTHSMFREQMDYFSENYKVIVCDLRGNGKSGKLSQSKEEILDTQCTDLIILLNELQIREAVFVGVSYGGILVQHLASSYPNRVKALVIVDSISPEAETSGTLRKIQLAAAYCSWVTYYAPSEWILPALRLSYQRWRPAYQVIRRSMLEKRPRELYKQRIAMALAHLPTSMELFSKPVLCLAADSSEYELHKMEALAARIRNAQFGVISDSLSPSNLCQPDLFNQVVRSFLETSVTQ